MSIIFTRNNTIVSRGIRRVTGEPVSHVAILLYGKYVVHSNFLGTRIESLESFTKHSYIVYEVHLPEHHICLSRILSSLAAHRGYDFGAMLYLGILGLTPKWLRARLPNANLWNASGSFICTELVTYILDGKPDAMVTPLGLYNRLMEKYNV